MTTWTRAGPALGALLALGTGVLFAAPRDAVAALRVCADIKKKKKERVKGGKEKRR